MTNVTKDQVEQALGTIDNRFRPILDPRASSVIAQAKVMLKKSHEAFVESRRQRRKERQVHPWGFEIHPETPLRFRDTDIDGLKVRVDLFLAAYWKDHPGEVPSDLRVVIRVWSLDPHVYFREPWDAARLEHECSPQNGRVMLRLHFDLANPNQPGPRHHLQVGGNARPEELHWFPEALSVPRLLHMPMDLVLASELVAATFYPDEYKKIRREGAWKGSRNVSQQHLLKGYFTEALEAVDTNESVLDALWNVSWDG